MVTGGIVVDKACSHLPGTRSGAPETIAGILDAGGATTHLSPRSAGDIVIAPSVLNSLVAPICVPVGSVRQGSVGLSNPAPADTEVTLEASD